MFIKEAGDPVVDYLSKPFTECLKWEDSKNQEKCSHNRSTLQKLQTDLKRE